MRLATILMSVSSALASVALASAQESCAVCHGPRERSSSEALTELERAGGQARAVLRRTVQRSAADDLARVVTTACVLAKRAAVTCDAPTVAAAHLVCDQICEAALRDAGVERRVVKTRLVGELDGLVQVLGRKHDDALARLRAAS